MASSTSTYITNIEIKTDGLTITRVNYLRISQRFEGHHSFEISVSPEMLSGKPDLDGLAHKIIGKGIMITLKQVRIPFTPQEQIFKGHLTSIRMVKGQGKTTTYLISGVSLTIMLADGKATRSFTDQTLDAIIKSTVNESRYIKPTYKTKIPYITQYEEDSFHFLQRLAQTYGEWFYYDGQHLIFGKDARPSLPTITLTNNSNLFDLEYNLRVLPFSYKTEYLNYTTGIKPFKADASTEEVSGLNSYTKLAFERSNQLFNFKENQDLGFTDYASEVELKTAVKLQKSIKANKLAVVSGHTPEMELKIGGLITVKEPIYIDGKQVDVIDYGTLVVTQLNHVIDTTGVYQAFFEAIPQDTDWPPVDYNIVPRRAQPQVATVQKTEDDLGLGRIKVKFWWQETDNETTPWIRVSSAMTGKSKSYFIPEIGDIVMVDFEYGNPDLPYVVGSLYANESAKKPGELFKEDNHIKGIITRSGNHIVVDDTDGKEKIMIFNKENKNKIELSLDGGSHINISSNGSVNINAANINIKASKKLIMEGKELVGIDSDKLVDVHSEEIVGVSGKNEAGISSEKDVKIDGKKVEITAQTDIKVEAGANLDLKGGPKATLKGGMVEIN